MKDKGVDRTRERFDKWSKKYEDGLLSRWLFQPLHRDLMELISPRQGEKLLDVGCGTGAFARKLSLQGVEVCGVDISPGMVAVAKEKAAGLSDLSFIESPADSLPFEPEVFDRVVTVAAYHHFHDPGKSGEEMYRVLRPGGRIDICDPCREGIAFRPFLKIEELFCADTYHYAREELVNILAGFGFEETEARLIRRIPLIMLVSGKKPIKQGGYDKGGAK